MTAKTTAAIAARLTAPRQVGGWSQPLLAALRAAVFLTSAGASAARPVRPRASIVPAGGAAVLALALALGLGHQSRER